ncbi:MAG: PaaI family thioesterase [Rhodospirillaceae bacterium]|nr:PaaI family thioesterase [Rhodospirillaceae bacterium]MBL6929971.1 PaaI family thioesterase [Rhodospirillales bacterium]MBL6940748.1 PaaI family thioesterase [Rhodospirillales bacterium]
MLKDIQSLKDKGDYSSISNLIPYTRVIGLQCAVEDGAMVTRLRHQDSNIGNYQMAVLHGGTVAALLEHAAIFQLLFELDIKAIPRIINISVDYLRPCRAMDTQASAVLVKQGQRIANVRVQAWQSDPAKPVATAHAHFLLS